MAKCQPKEIIIKCPCVDLPVWLLPYYIEYYNIILKSNLFITKESCEVHVILTAYGLHKVKIIVNLMHAHIYLCRLNMMILTFASMKSLLCKNWKALFSFHPRFVVNYTRKVASEQLNSKIVESSEENELTFQVQYNFDSLKVKVSMVFNNLLSFVNLLQDNNSKLYKCHYAPIVITLW